MSLESDVSTEIYGICPALSLEMGQRDETTNADAVTSSQVGSLVQC